MSLNKKRGGRGSSNSRHLRPNKAQHSFNTSGSSSLNWRGELNKNNLNESNNYGYNNHYLTSAFCMLIGLPVKIQKTDGSIYEGILETVSNKLEFHLSHVAKLNNGIINSGDGVETALFQFSDVVYCKANDVDLDYAKRNALLTDSAISGSNGPINERELIEWQPEDNGIQLDDLDLNGSWSYDDMIRVNAEKHGVRSTFDSTMANYMTPLEKRSDEEYKEQERRAEQMAREMQKDSRHREHEAADSGVGEEELFSSVSRNSNSMSNSPNNVPSNNDGFTTYTKPHRANRGKGTNIVGPRLQRNNRNQEPLHHGNINQQGNNRNTVPPKVQNGSISRNNFYQQQPLQAHQSKSSDPPFNPANRDNAPFSPSQSSQETVHNSPARPTLSYSAVTMTKQQQQQQHQQQSVNNRVNPIQKSISPQPLMQQQVSAPLQSIENTPLLPTNNAPKSTNLLTSPLQTGIPNQEALAVAKAQVIHNSKNYASMAAQSGLQSQSPVTQGQKTQQATTAKKLPLNQPVQQQPATYSGKPTQQPNTLLRSSSSETPLPQRTVEKKVAPLSIPLDQKSDATPNFPTKEVKGLVKFGKHNPTVGGEDEKKASSTNVNELKTFAQNFKLPDTKTRPTAAKKAPLQTKIKCDEKETATSFAEPVSKIDETLTKLVTTTSNVVGSPVPVSSVTKTIVSSTSSVVQSTMTVSSSVSTSATSTSLKSALNPSAKEFTLNAAAKEFTMPTVSKQPLAKQTSFTVEPVPQPPQPYYPAHAAPPVINNQHQPAEIIQPHQQPVVNKVYGRYPSTVYSIPTGGEYSNMQPPIPAGFINQNMQNMPNQQVILVHAPNGGMHYQSVMPAANHQQFLPMQGQGVIRYVNAHHGSNAVQQPTRLPSNFSQEGMQNGGYVIAVSQHGGVIQHQPVASNQHHNFAVPPPSQQYMVNSSYQITSPHVPGGNGPSSYRPTAPMHSNHQQLVMMHQQSQHVQAQQHGMSTIPTNQQYVQGQPPPHAGILQNYPPTGN